MLDTARLYIPSLCFYLFRCEVQMEDSNRVFVSGGSFNFERNLVPWSKITSKHRTRSWSSLIEGDEECFDPSDRCFEFGKPTHPHPLLQGWNSHPQPIIIWYNVCLECNSLLLYLLRNYVIFMYPVLYMTIPPKI